MTTKLTSTGNMHLTSCQRSSRPTTAIQRLSRHRALSRQQALHLLTIVPPDQRSTISRNRLTQTPIPLLKQQYDKVPEEIIPELDSDSEAPLHQDIVNWIELWNNLYRRTKKANYIKCTEYGPSLEFIKASKSVNPEFSQGARGTVMRSSVKNEPVQTIPELTKRLLMEQHIDANTGFVTYQGLDTDNPAASPSPAPTPKSSDQRKVNKKSQNKGHYLRHNIYRLRYNLYHLRHNLQAPSEKPPLPSAQTSTTFVATSITFVATSTTFVATSNHNLYLRHATHHPTVRIAMTRHLRFGVDSS